MDGRGEKHEALYGVRPLNLEPAANSALSLVLEYRDQENISHFNAMPDAMSAISAYFLDFTRFRAFNPGTSRKDLLFDPPPGP